MGKRVKQYKRLMRSFEHLGFRQPYQLLMTSDVVLETLKLDVIALFEKTLSTKNIKPMITQCCIRSLYDRNLGPNRDPAIVGAIERAKTFERRRCGHLMDEAAKPEAECMMSVVDPKGNGQNKFRYIVATQDEELRGKLRSVVPTPLMYIRRSVMILEPMSHDSAKVREREEHVKFSEGIIRRPTATKRKREGEDSDAENGSDDEGSQAGDAAKGDPKPKKKSYVKGPNPLAVKKAKKMQDEKMAGGEKTRKPAPAPVPAPEAEPPAETKAKRKRRKKTKAPEDGPDSQVGGGEQQAKLAVVASTEN
ncbi:Fcf1-domain-containing protein [Podospora didyma]|uniref:U three protein 23 n=1 Tax=Podospora didyma TaxID=330526 RepID=A0AAE0P796_9PEZI|nr:Fcf1-domain-containing protein [Podospora didyma]